MSPMAPLGRVLMVTGAVLFLAGLLITVVGRIPRLPGDVLIERPGVTIFLPVGWMILISIIATILLNVVFRR
jgi:hypothetical protein